jgi:hypothetical protein
MRAAGTPLKDRVATVSTWTLGIAIVAVAGSALSLAPSRTPLTPGSVFSYAEDRLGRPWRIVRCVGYQTYEIRNGRVLVIAEADDLSPYRGYTHGIRVDMAGVMWREKIAEIQKQQLQIAAHDDARE